MPWDPLPVEPRFWAAVEQMPNGCWQWRKATSGGYGIINWNGRKHYAHRVSYQLFVGDIPAGLQLDHLCRNRGCVNPEHLQPVTPQVNTLRSAPATKASCAQGHPFDEANTRWRGTWRICVACAREAVRKSTAKSRGQAA